MLLKNKCSRKKERVRKTYKDENISFQLLFTFLNKKKITGLNKSMLCFLWIKIKMKRFCIKYPYVDLTFPSNMVKHLLFVWLLVFFCLIFLSVRAQDKKMKMDMIDKPPNFGVITFSFFLFKDSLSLSWYYLFCKRFNLELEKTLKILLMHLIIHTYIFQESKKAHAKCCLPDLIEKCDKYMYLNMYFFLIFYICRYINSLFLWDRCNISWPECDVH